MYKLAVVVAVVLLACGVVLAQNDDGWTGRTSGKLESPQGQPVSNRFDILLGFGGRTDESGSIDRDYSIGGGLLFRLNRVAALQANVASEKTRINMRYEDGRGSSSMGEVLFRVTGTSYPLAPFCFAGTAFRHLYYQDKYGYASENEAGVVFGAGLAVGLSDVLSLDLSLRHEMDKSLDNAVYVTTMPPPEPWRFVYERNGVPDDMFNPTSVQVQFRLAMR